MVYRVNSSDLNISASKESHFMISVINDTRAYKQCTSVEKMGKISSEACRVNKTKNGRQKKSQVRYYIQAELAALPLY